MKLAPRITYRSMEHSPALDERITEELNELSALAPEGNCHVTVSQPHHHSGALAPVHVRVVLTLNGRQFVAERPTEEPVKEDAYQSVRGAFESIQRQVTHARERAHAGSHGR